MGEPTRIVALISGGGRTVLNLLDAIGRGEMRAKVVGAVASRPDISGIAKLEARGVPCRAVDQRSFRSASGKGTDWAAMNAAVNAHVLELAPDLVILAGYMCHYHVTVGFEHRVMNIHPALIPCFCGKGMYGHHVHEAVVARGVKVTGCTVHFVDNEYDHGPIIVQRTCPVFDTDTADDVADRVFTEECKAYPEAIRLFGEGRLSVKGDVVRVAPEW